MHYYKENSIHSEYNWGTFFFQYQLHNEINKKNPTKYHQKSTFSNKAKHHKMMQSNLNEQFS